VVGDCVLVVASGGWRRESVVSLRAARLEGLAQLSGAEAPGRDNRDGMTDCLVRGWRLMM
jgi:hypothetical protein